ncbi:DUF6884 domain-containing protein [Blastococcus brunescens]|uniref:DUF6884 domain-containing protein n=1 Tax=Blastococcus brunescens TaxID=1564165 RepID=UPI003BEF4162
MAAVGAGAAAAPGRPRSLRPPPRGADPGRRRPRDAAGPHRVLRGTAAEPLPVARIFASPGFARARDAAVRAGLPWFVLSAAHGVLDADDVVGPFDPRSATGPPATARPGASGWWRSWPSGPAWTASRSRCTAASTSPSHCASRSPPRRHAGDPAARRMAGERRRGPVAGRRCG